MSFEPAWWVTDPPPSRASRLRMISTERSISEPETLAPGEPTDLRTISRPGPAETFGAAEPPPQPTRANTHKAKSTPATHDEPPAEEMSEPLGERSRQENSRGCAITTDCPVDHTSFANRACEAQPRHRRQRRRNGRTPEHNRCFGQSRALRPNMNRQRCRADNRNQRQHDPQRHQPGTKSTQAARASRPPLTRTQIRLDQ